MARNYTIEDLRKAGDVQNATVDECISRLATTNTLKRKLELARLLEAAAVAFLVIQQAIDSAEDGSNGQS